MISLDKEKETLWIPLYGKARESQKKSPILKDPKAEEIIGRIDLDFKSLNIPEKTNTMMCLRAKLFDNYVRNFLDKSGHTVVIHLGCGLDSRYDRIQQTHVQWFDLDFEEVISLRKKFYSESETYHLIPSSVTDKSWIESIPTGYDDYLVIAEGLFMYLREAEIKTLLRALKERIGRYTLIFDAFSTYTAKRISRHPSLKKTGASIQWGIDDPDHLTTWDPHIRWEKEIWLTSNEEIQHLNMITRLIYKIAHLFPMVRKAHRILVYSVHS